MTPGFSRPSRKRRGPGAAQLALAALLALIAATDHARARGGGERTVEAIETRTAGAPILAVVSLRKQRITVYDAEGWILRAPVSSGQRGRETPAGVFSVIEKEAEHYSNLYDDAYMPDMQRLTWSGIALHGGVLPGHPASHGCIRMPYDFAARLFEVTQRGLRVIVAPTDVTPVEIAHPLLPRPKPGAAALVASRNAEAVEATRKSDQTRQEAGTAYREAMQATVPARTTENLKRRAEARLTATEATLASASSPEAKQDAEDAKAKAAAKVTELQAQSADANAALQPKLDALKAARDAAEAAEAARAAAVEAAHQAARELQPVSILISRKSQRLYVRQGFEPVFDVPITIQDADRPIGTRVFTAVDASGDSGVRWNVVALVGSKDAEPIPTEPDGAKAALDRIVIPQDALDRIPGGGPGSSLIVTDEAASSETGKGTDFVVLLSGEPQGGIKFRSRGPTFGYARSRMPFFGMPFRGPFWFR